MRRPAEQAAWQQFVKLYTPLVCHWARRLGLAGDDVADLVQDVFAVLVEELPRFQYDASKRFRAWLWTLTLNKVQEKRRRRAIPTELASDDALSEVTVVEPRDGFMEREYHEFLAGRALELMQAEFQPTTWKAFWDCAVHDRSAADVGAELGISVAAVYAAKSRVVRRLRQELAGLLD